MTEKKQDKSKEYRNLVERLAIFYELPVGLFNHSPSLTIDRARNWVAMLDSGKVTNETYGYDFSFILEELAYAYGGFDRKRCTPEIRRLVKDFDGTAAKVDELFDNLFNRFKDFQNHPVQYQHKIYSISFSGKDIVPSIVGGYAGPDTFALKFIAYIPVKEKDSIERDYKYDETRIIESVDKYDITDSFIETEQGVLMYPEARYFFKKYMHIYHDYQLEELSRKTRKRYDVDIPVEELKLYAERMRMHFSHGHIQNMGDIHLKNKKPKRKRDYDKLASVWNRAKKHNIFGDNWPDRKILE